MSTALSDVCAVIHDDPVCNSSNKNDKKYRLRIPRQCSQLIWQRCSTPMFTTIVISFLPFPFTSFSPVYKCLPLSYLQILTAVPHHGMWFYWNLHFKTHYLLNIKSAKNNGCWVLRRRPSFSSHLTQRIHFPDFRTVPWHNPFISYWNRYDG